ncbi:MAG: hypothetical protein KGQ60_05335 [Planctomycetes bacterium]|nr:hypothetical protein [Planctomycetota bacterium]
MTASCLDKFHPPMNETIPADRLRRPAKHPSIEKGVINTIPKIPISMMEARYDPVHGMSL